jgi:putative membrane protein
MKTAIKNLTLAFLGIAITIASCTKDNHYSMANQDFVTQASSSNMFEVAAGNLAMNNGTNADVKAYGSHMVSDHTVAGTEMANLAAKKGWSVPTTMMPKHQSNYNMLAGLTGAAFDKQFAAMMVMSHQETIDLFQRASSGIGVPDDELRGFAAGKLPTLNEHLQHAIELKAKVGQ